MKILKWEILSSDEREQRENEIQELELQVEEGYKDIKLLKRQMEDLGWKSDLANDNLSTDFLGLNKIDAEKLRTIMKRSYLYWQRDPHVGRNIGMKVDYIIGKGYKMPKTENKELADIFRRFWSNPVNKNVLTRTKAQRNRVRELEITGNLFIVAVVDQTGDVSLGIIPPEQITDVVSDPINRERVLYYRREYVPQKYDFQKGEYRPEKNKKVVKYYRHWQNVPANKDQDPTNLAEGAFVFHVARNQISGQKFGLPDSVRVMSWVDAYNEFMRIRMHILKAIAKLTQHKKVKGKARQVQKILDQDTAELQKYASGLEAGEFLAPPQKYGQTLVSTDDISYEQVKMDSGASAAHTDGRMIKGSVSVGFGFPLHYQGDVGGANLATATSMELPILKMIESEQNDIDDLVKDIHDFVIIQAIKHNKIKQPEKGRFSDEKLLKENFILEALESDDSEGKNKVEELAYTIQPPAVLQKQVSEIMNALSQVAMTVDPYVTNVELSRWVFEQALELVNYPNPDDIVKRVFPEGFEYPTQAALDQAFSDTGIQPNQRGRADQREGDSLSNTRQKPKRPGRLPSEVDTGQKNLKRARRGDNAKE